MNYTYNTGCNQVKNVIDGVNDTGITLGKSEGRANNVASPILEATSHYPFGLQQKGIGPAQTEFLHNFKNDFQKAGVQ